MFNYASVKDDVMALASKTETLLINRRKQNNINHYFAPLQTKRKVIRNLEISYTCLFYDF